jgi:hypothetical protein
MSMYIQRHGLVIPDPFQPCKWMVTLAAKQNFSHIFLLGFGNYIGSEREICIVAVADGCWRDSEPYGAGALEHGHELAGEVQRHDLVGGANEVAADEDSRDRRRAAEAAGELPLHVAAARVLVQLVHRRAHAKLGEEARHRVAHRALAPREDHHRLLRRQPRHPLRHRLLNFSRSSLK